MRLLIAGGGTGGHLFPALAAARAFKEEHPQGSVLFVGTRHGIEARIIPTTEFPIRFITTRGIRGTGMFNTLLGACELPLAVLQSLSIVREFNPHVVLGVGGYASGPTLAAAVIKRIPTAIQEQNSVMGTTNRVLSRFVDRIFISWENTEPAPPPEKTVLAGNPVRADLLDRGENAKDSEQLHVLIFGGSRGARSINLSLAQNVDVLTPLADRIKILHQTGAEAANEMRDAYRSAGIDAEVREFIDRMGPAYRWADLVVCRSGASSLAEITALGKPAILIPYPYAIGDHQARNARVLESEGAARVIADERLKNGALVKEIIEMLDNREVLDHMAKKCRTLGRPDAARVIARELLKMERSAS